jgi:hypothetical protein
LFSNLRGPWLSLNHKTDGSIENFGGTPIAKGRLPPELRRHAVGAEVPTSALVPSRQVLRLASADALDGCCFAFHLIVVATKPEKVSQGLLPDCGPASGPGRGEVQELRRVTSRGTN